MSRRRASNVAALRKAVHMPRIERWPRARSTFPTNLNFLVTSAPQVPLLYASENMVTQGVFAASATRGVPVLIDGDSFAYRTKRPNKQDRRVRKRCIRARPQR